MIALQNDLLRGLQHTYAPLAPSSWSCSSAHTQRSSDYSQIYRAVNEHKPLKPFPLILLTDNPVKVSACKEVQHVHWILLRSKDFILHCALHFRITMLLVINKFKIHCWFKFQFSFKCLSLHFQWKTIFQWTVVLGDNSPNTQGKKSHYNRKTDPCPRKNKVSHSLYAEVDWNMVHFLPERDRQWLQKRPDMIPERSHLRWKAGVKDEK